MGALRDLLAAAHPQVAPDDDDLFDRAFGYLIHVLTLSWCEHQRTHYARECFPCSPVVDMSENSPDNPVRNAPEVRLRV